VQRSAVRVGNWGSLDDVVFEGCIQKMTIHDYFGRKILLLSMIEEGKKKIE
jgi:hypothetical protein